MTLPLPGRFTVGKATMTIGELAQRSGFSRRAIRRYEGEGLLAPARRTAAGYRLYDGRAVDALRFVRQARDLGFTLTEIGQILALRRAGRPPCRHVLAMVRAKTVELDRTLLELSEIRRRLRHLLTAAASLPADGGVVCHHIEASATQRERRTPHGDSHDVALPGLHRVPRGRDRRR